jgi:hypothetical protein
MSAKLNLSLLIAIACVASSASATSYYQGLISFRNGPDPAGKTPVYWATKRTLHHVVHPYAAERKFGANWTAEIRWCGDSSGRPLSGECSDIFYNFKKGRAVDQNTQDLLNP